ncbi:MAG: hypothetical protein ACPGVT_13800, partial [Maricaulaceae bacterium]
MAFFKKKKHKKIRSGLKSKTISSSEFDVLLHSELKSHANTPDIHAKPAFKATKQPTQSISEKVAPQAPAVTKATPHKENSDFLDMLAEEERIHKSRLKSKHSTKTAETVATETHITEHTLPPQTERLNNLNHKAKELTPKPQAPKQIPTETLQQHESTRPISKEADTIPVKKDLDLSALEA